MKKFLLSFVALVASFGCLWAQSGLYIPSPKPVHNVQKLLVNPDAFCLLINFGAGDSTFALSDLDLLDSAYRIAFTPENPKLYTITIEGFSETAEEIAQTWVNDVYNYFANRSHSVFPIRYAFNKTHCSCMGDSIEPLRFEVPTSLKTYRCADLPDSRLVLNGNVSLRNTVLVTFQNNPAECIGRASGCFLPASDSTIRGYYTQLFLPKGSVYSVQGTKDTCPPPLEITLDEHFDYETNVERYFLVPHKKQIIVQAGYVVIHSNFNRRLDECKLPLADSVFLRIPISPEQWESRIKVYGKRLTEKGIEYKTLTARKITNKATGTLQLQVALNPTLFDTIFLGKRIKADEIGDYFYEVKSDREEGSFAIGEKYYMAYKFNRRGEYDSKKAFMALIRIPVEDDEPEVDEKKSSDDDDEEIIEE